MKISRCYPLRRSAGLALTFVPTSDSTSKAVSFNGPAELLWQKLQCSTFEFDNVVSILMEEYVVSLRDAQEGARQWIDQMKELGLIIGDNDVDELPKPEPVRMKAPAVQPQPQKRRRGLIGFLMRNRK